MKISFLLFALAVLPAGATTFRVQGTDATPWTKILGALGIEKTDSADSGIVVLGSDEQANVLALAENRIVLVEGTGAAARTLGIETKPEMVSVRQTSDVHAP